MKRRLISIVSIMAVLGLAWASFGQAENSTQGSSGSSASSTSTRGQGRWEQWRQSQQKAVAAIDEQLSKIKTAMESSPTPLGNWSDMSDEERNKLREQFRKRREDRTKSLGLIEDQILMLKGRRSVYEEHDKSMNVLKRVLELAMKEDAKETSGAIEKLIAQKTKDFEKRMKKLGLERPRSRRTRGN